MGKKVITLSIFCSQVYEVIRIIGEKVDQMKLVLPSEPNQRNSQKTNTDHNSQGDTDRHNHD